MSTDVERLQSAFPGKVGSSLDPELAATVTGYQGLSICECEGGDCVTIRLENDTPSQEQLDAIDAVIAAHDPLSSAIEDAVTETLDYLNGLG